jgi:hypothetical protein
MACRLSRKEIEKLIKNHTDSYFCSACNELGIDDLYYGEIAPYMDEVGMRAKNYHTFFLTMIIAKAEVAFQNEKMIFKLAVKLAGEVFKHHESTKKDKEDILDYMYKLQDAYPVGNPCDMWDEVTGLPIKLFVDFENPSRFNWQIHENINWDAQGFFHPPLYAPFNKDRYIYLKDLKNSEEKN